MPIDKQAETIGQVSETVVYGIPIVAAIIALVELAKKTGLPDKFAPVLAVVLGIVAGTVVVYPENLTQGIFVGIGYGLSAAGTYSGVKTIKQG